MADKEFVLRLRVNADGTLEPVQKLGDELDNAEEKTKKLGETAKKSEGGFKKLADGIKNIGKATGVIALVAAAFNTIKSVISSTQPIADLFAAGFGTLTDIIRDAFNFIVDNSGKVIDFFKGIFEDPVQALKDFGTAIKENLIERFNSFLDTLGYLAEGVKNLFQGEFSAALDSFGKAGKESIDVLTGVNNTVDRVTDAVVDGTAALVDYVSETFKANQELVKLQNNAKLAAAQQARLAEQYDREAELQRQLRDDTSKSIQSRIDANKRLGEILDKQEKAELAAAQAQVAAAQATYQHNKTIDNQVALTQALAAVDGVRAKIAGLRSEQLVNEIGLNKELNELYKTQQNSIADLSLNQQKFAADSIKNERDRLKAQREVLEEQKKNELARLQSQVDAYAEGTQDRINAEIEYNTKKQELDQALATNATALTEAEIARNLELNTLRAQNDLENSAQRIKLLELEYAEKERLANGDNEKIIELEKEKQRKILQIEAEAKDAKLGLAIQGLTVLSDFTALFGKKNEASAKRAFQIQKGLSIAQAVMETYKGAQAIFASTAANPGTILFPGQPFVAAGLAIAAGLANVAKIASQKFEGGGAPAGGGAGGVPSLGGGGGGGVGGGTVPTFNALNLGFLQNRPDQTPRAYVLAQDVSTAVEARDKVRDLARIN